MTISTCGDRQPIRVAARGRHLAVDIHCHLGIPAADEARACLVEITRLGKDPLTLPDGTQRVMLEDGDTLTLRGRAVAEGHVPIGFGPCSGTVVPAKAAA